ncbi:hypothetical protein Tco_0099584 [Tanacetum coccineum]
MVTWQPLIGGSSWRTRWRLDQSDGDTWHWRVSVQEKSIPQASIRSRKSRIDPTLSNFTISTKRIPFSTVETVNSLKIGDKHLDTQKGSLESSVKDPIPIPSVDRALTGVDLTRGCHVACHIMAAGQSEAATWSSNHWVRGVVHSIAVLVNAIAYDLPTKEPEDSLIMGNEELSTIPEKESDEFIKSSVEDLILIPRESEDTSGSDSENVLPSSDDFSPIFEEKSVTFSNPLFDSNDFTYSDNELLSAIRQNIESKDSYVSNLDELALLVTPLFDVNKDECFDPGGVIDEIDAFLDMDISTNIENGYHDSEGDIIYLESLLIDDTSPNLPPEVFLDHDPRSLKDEPDNDDLMTEDKVFDPGSEDTIFDPDIPLSFFYFIKARWAYENPIVIFPFSVSAPRTKEFGESQARDSHKNKRFSGGNPCLFFFLFS